MLHPALALRYQQALKDRENKQLLRQLPPTITDIKQHLSPATAFHNGEVIDFASNDYLGIARILNALGITRSTNLPQDANLPQGGATGSRLLTGNYPEIMELEKRIALYHNAPKALVFGSGFMANLGLLSTVANRHDWVFYDSMIHASVREGIRLWAGASFSFLHNDLADLMQKYKQVQANYTHKNGAPFEGSVFLVVESIYSMDGDAAPLEAITGWCIANQVNLIVDEAHAVGLFGKNGAGMCVQLGLESQIFARVITYGKALGCEGAAILGDDLLIQYLINFCRAFIYTTAPSLHFTQTIQSAYLILESMGDFPAQNLHALIKYFKEKYQETHFSTLYPKMGGDAAIICVEMGKVDDCKNMAQKLIQNGFDVRAILPPTVNKGKEMLRICLHDYNTETQIDAFMALLDKIIPDT